MFDTMTLTKILGGFCGALLIFLLGNWAAETLYSTEGGHGDDHAQAYVIDTGSDDDAGEEAEAEPTIEEMMASADVAKGKKTFSKCKACHKAEDGANSTGPHLYGVVGRAVGSVDSFGAYSGSLNAAAETWTAEALNGFLASPKQYAPGTSMAFNGLSKPEDRANVIAYLDSLDN